MHRPPRKVSSHLEAHLRAIQCAYKLSSRLDCRCVCAAMADDVNCRIVCGEMAADVRLVGGQCGRQRYGSGAHWKWGGEDPSLPDQASPTARPKHSSAGCPLGRSTCREGNARRWGPWSATDTVVPPSQGLGHWGFAESRYDTAPARLSVHRAAATPISMDQQPRSRCRGQLQRQAAHSFLSTLCDR